MKLRVFLFLILFFNSFSVFAITNSKALSACNLNKQNYSENFQAAISCSVLTEPPTAAYCFFSSSDNRWYGNCHYYDSCTDGKVIDPITKACVPFSCPVGQIEDPVNPGQCVEECKTADIGRLVGVRICLNSPTCKYQYVWLGINYCVMTPPEPPPEYTCADGVTKVTDLSQCPANLTCPDGVTKVKDYSECPVDKDCSKYGEGWVFNEVMGACVKTDLKMCPDGVTQVQNLSDCPFPKLTCSDGVTKVYVLSECPADLKTCPDGVTKVADLVLCPADLKTCPDGVTKVADLALCPLDSCTSQPYHHKDTYGNCVPDTINCSDGSVVYPPATCPAGTTSTGGTGTGATTGGTGTGGTTGGTTGNCVAGDACNQTEIKKNTKDTATNTKDSVTLLQDIKNLLQLQILKETIESLARAVGKVVDIFTPSSDPNKKSMFDQIKDLISAASDLKNLAQGEPDICEKNPDIEACLKQGEELKKVEITEKPLESKFEPKIPNFGSCPAPEIINTSLANYQFSYQPLCDFSIQIRPLIISLAYVAAAYIVSSSIRRV